LDGYSDIVVGAYASSSDLGAAYVYLGGAGGIGATPLVLPAMGGTDAYFGGAVASAGDVNRDGFTEVIVGAYGASGGNGSAYLFMGGGTGPSTTPVVFTGPGGSIGNFGQSVFGDAP
jgi:hypothetical protein